MPSSQTKDNLNRIIHHEIEYLLTHNSHPEISTGIGLVWVFSGSGTFDKPLDPEDKSWMEWMDKYRILYGILLVKKITAERLNKTIHDVTIEDIKTQGPFFLYNGRPEENESLKHALEKHLWLPKEKVLVVDCLDDTKPHPIRNTLDQIKSFPSGLSPRTIALVSHAEHFPRILRYLEKYDVIHKSSQLEIFALIPPKEGLKEYEQEEIEKIWEYFQRGDLSWNPFPIEA